MPRIIIQDKSDGTKNKERRLKLNGEKRPTKHEENTKKHAK